MSLKGVSSSVARSGTAPASMLTLAGLVWCSLAVPIPASASSAPEIPVGDGVAGQFLDVRDPTGWEVQSSEFTDLWYGALATIGLYGFGPMPLYDAGYVRSARVRKEAAGIYPTALDLAAASLLRALRSDDAFEVLHFTPVYFAEATVEEAFTALRAVTARPSGVPTGLPASSRFGASVVASVLTTETQRAVLASLLDVIEGERGTPASIGSEADRVPTERRQEIQTLWNRDLMSRLTAYAGMRGLESGRLIVTPALGREGRFFEGDPSNSRDNVVVVGVGSETTPAEAVSALARELCFPVVREAMSKVDLDSVNRRDASRTSDRAATRCGAILLAELAPDATAAYERYFGADAHLLDEEAGLESDREALRLTELERELDALMRRDIQRR